jgi:hypothetical protein
MVLLEKSGFHELAFVSFPEMNLSLPFSYFGFFSFDADEEGDAALSI